ncbi:ATP-dependent DNA helicase [Trueperella pyogenes]|uniref:ATP-dependent DNA helicase n=1 Tax=Trueperella pyogenes TaxID=1661 RepID=UPI00312B34F4
MTSYEDFAATLEFRPTCEQEAVIRSEDHAIAVIAGAGSGKTATMSQRIAWHVVNGNVRPEEVLGLTFTNKATGELAERVERQLRAAAANGLIAPSLQPGESEADAIHREFARPTIATYNSFASEIASSYAMLIGEDPRARLITDAERYQIMARIVSDIAAEDPRFTALADRSVSSIVSNALHLADQMTGNMVDAEELRAYLAREAAALMQITDVRAKRGTLTEHSKAEQTKTKGMLEALKVRICLTFLVEEYLAYKKDNSLIEFADQVVRASRILAEVPQVGDDLRSRYKLILLDEYQDTSSSQAAFIASAFSGAWSVCAVGDPNQAIYSWRGASSAALSDFMDSFAVARNLTLSTAFRNGQRILDVANALTVGKLSYPKLDMKTLQPRPNVQAGEVVLIHRTYREDSYRDLAAHFADAFAKVRRENQGEAGQPNSPMPTAAILCRARSYMPYAIKALEEAGVPYEVVGGEVLIEKQEIRLVRSVLGLAVNPARNDLLVALLTFFAIGTKDIAALSAFARAQAKVTEDQLSEQVSDGAVQVAPNLVEALDTLPAEPVPGMSDVGHERLIHIADLLARARASRHLTVPEAISTVIDLLDLRAYAKARRSGGARVQDALASFIGLGAKFAGEMGAGLEAFVEWVDMLEAHEGVAEGEASADAAIMGQGQIEPESGVVQLLTIHAAKGLEWDLVGIPDMRAGGFDERLDEKLWQESIDALPYSFREDRNHLPDFVLSDELKKWGIVTAENKATILETIHEHRTGQFAKHHIAESRRLAYVAVTRPRNLLVLASYDLASADKAANALKNLTKDAAGEAGEITMPRNVFITDVEHLAEPGPGNDAVLTAADLERIATDDSSEAAEEEETRVWPRDIDRSLDTFSGAFQVAEPGKLVEQWAREAEVIVAERHSPPAGRGLARDYLTASDVVALAQDSVAFLADQYRPIPHRPSRAARTGVLVHEAIAHHFDAPATLDVDAVAFPGEMPFDVGELNDQRQAELVARFEASRYSSCPPLAVEEAIDVRVGDYPIRCVIDAVLDTSALSGSPKVTVVDWKTGRRPSPDQVASRQFQLGLYRLAWSRATGTDLNDIGACFYYLGEDDVHLRELHAGDLTEAQISEHIRTHLEQA